MSVQGKLFEERVRLVALPSVLAYLCLVSGNVPLHADQAHPVARDCYYCSDMSLFCDGFVEGLIEDYPSHKFDCLAFTMAVRDEAHTVSVCAVRNGNDKEFQSPTATA